MVTTFTDTHTAFAAMTVAWKSTCAPGHIAALQSLTRPRRKVRALT